MILSFRFIHLRSFAATLLLAASLGANASGQAPDGASGIADPTIPTEDLREFVGNGGDRDASRSPRGVIEIEVSADGIITYARFVEAPLASVAEALGEAVQSNVIVGSTISDRRITLTLRDIDLTGALQAIAVSQGLVSHLDKDSDIYVLATPDDVRRDVSALRTNQTEVFTLLYPNARDVVRAIGDVFGDRVIVTKEGDSTENALRELEERFDRFDLIEERSRGLTGAIGGTNVRTSQSGYSRNFNRNQRFNQNNNIARPRSFRPVEQPEPPELTAEEARRVVEALAGQEEATNEARRIATRNAVTFVTSIERLNRIIVRTDDPKIIEEIRGLIQRLDVPTPLVLLEVRVLRIDLSDDLESAFDLAFQAGEMSGAFSEGEIAAPPIGSVLPGGDGVDLRAGVFQVVSNNVQARLQVLQSKGRVTALATPILLTANNEVSRIFSGEQIPIVVGFTEPQVITGEGATTVLSATPVTELRNVGTDLLITANINVDRTVTLRLLQETSTVKKDGASILVPAGTSLVTGTVDTVTSQSASGTIVASDGMLLAFGGLIEEIETDNRQQWPVLGDLPLIGFLFRRESSLIQRTELIVLVRPYVLMTPMEGDAISRNLLDALSIHPYRSGEGAIDGSEDDWGVYRDKDLEFDRSLFDTFRYHTTPALDGDKQ